MFFCCYLLHSLSVAKSKRTYIGFTVNPETRLRQHNGEIANGAKQTSKYRPWEMVLFVYGFNSKTVALQFEWAWQNPFLSLLLREKIGNLSGRKKTLDVRGKMEVLYQLLSVEPFCRMQLSIQFLSPQYYMGEKEQIPPHVKVNTNPIFSWDLLLGCNSDAVANNNEEDKDEHNDIADENKDNVGDDVDDDGDDVDGDDDGEEHSRNCFICSKIANDKYFECKCHNYFHLVCLAKEFLKDDDDQHLIPTSGKCASCFITWNWKEVVQITRSLTSNANLANSNTLKRSLSNNNNNSQKNRLPPLFSKNRKVADDDDDDDDVIPLFKRLEKQKGYNNNNNNKEISILL